MPTWDTGSAYPEDLGWPYLIVDGERVQVQLNHDIHGYFLVDVFGRRYPPSQEGVCELVDELMQQIGKGVRGGG